MAVCVVVEWTAVAEGLVAVSVVGVVAASEPVQLGTHVLPCLCWQQTVPSAC